MLRTPSAFAAHPDEFVPQVIPLDASPDALGALSSERAPTQASPPVVDSCGCDPLTALDLAATAIQLPPSANETAGVQPVSARPKAAITLRVPKGAGTACLAILGGALSGLVIAATQGPSVGAVAPPRARAGSTAGVDALERTDRVAPSSPRVTTTAAFRPVPSGWLSISAAFPVTVYEDGVEVPRDASGRLVLPAGPHALTLVNEPLEFHQDQAVTIAARRTVSVAVDTPVGALHVNARPWAAVWVDGKRAGDTPIGNLAVPIGEHEIVLRHPALGEQRRTVVVGARTPARVGVEWQP